MATFWKNIKNKYGVKTYQDTKNSYDWVMKAIRNGNFDCENLSADFLFKVSGILCSCKGIDEFTENAYGYTDYELNHFRVSFWPTEYGHVGIDVQSDNRVSISTESRVLLEEIVKLLENTSLEDGTDSPVTVIQVKMNDGFSVKQFLAGILQNIVSNFIWYLLTFGAGIILTYLATR